MIIFLCVIYIFIPGNDVEETYFEQDKQFLLILQLIFKLIDRPSCSFFSPAVYVQWFQNILVFIAAFTY